MSEEQWDAHKPIMDDSNQTFSTLPFYFILFFIFSSSLYIIIEALVGTPAITTTSATELVRTIALVVDVILAFALVYIYYNISNIQRKEKDITKEMKKYSEKQTKINKQIAEIEKSRNKPKIKSKVKVEEGNIVLECKNIGTGIATNINVVTEFFVSKESNKIPAAYEVGVPVQKIENLNLSEVSKRGEEMVEYDVSYSPLDYNRIAKRGSKYSMQSEESLNPNKKAKFNIEQRVNRYRDLTGGPPESITIESMISDFVDQFSTFTLCCRLYLEYEDIVGEKKHAKN